MNATRRRIVAGGSVSPQVSQVATPVSTGSPGWLKRGAAIIETADREQQLAQERQEMRKSGMGNVFRFYLKEPGEQAEIVVLDKSLDDVVALYEHNLFNPTTKTSALEMCVKEFANCPVCEKFKPSYYVMFLTVLDLRGYDRKLEGGGTEHVKQTRRLMPVKMGQIQKWKQIAQGAIKEFGTLRGLYLVMERGKGDQSPNIGEPVLLDNNKLFDHLTEEQLVSEFGHPAIIGRDGKTVVKPLNADITAFDYEKMFPEPNPDDLNKRYGGLPNAGSAQEVVAEFGAQAQAETQSGRLRRTAVAPATSRVRARPVPVSTTPPVNAAAEEEEPFEG